MKEPLHLEDTDKIKHLIIRVNLDKNKVQVISAFDAWKNLALLMEALGMTIKMAIKEGRSKKEVYEGVKNYLNEVLVDYDKVWKEKINV